MQNLTSATLQVLAASATLVSSASGETFFRQGDPPTGLYILQTGRVKLCRQSRQRTQILALLLPGDWFGSESLPADSASPCTATALTPSQSIFIPPEVLHHLISHYPDFQEALIEITAQRLRQLVSLVHDLAFRDVASRLATVLVTRTHLEGSATSSGIRIDRLLSQQEFAEMIGTAREVINRAFKRFEQNGLLRLTPDHIFILDLTRLAEIAEQETS
jgi:CRP/FNR family transcriptional regulator